MQIIPSSMLPERDKDSLRAFLSGCREAAQAKGHFQLAVSLCRSSISLRWRCWNQFTSRTNCTFMWSDLRRMRRLQVRRLWWRQFSADRVALRRCKRLPMKFWQIRLLWEQDHIFLRLFRLKMRWTKPLQDHIFLRLLRLKPPHLRRMRRLQVRRRQFSADRVALLQRFWGVCAIFLRLADEV